MLLDSLWAQLGSQAVFSTSFWSRAFVNASGLDNKLAEPFLNESEPVTFGADFLRPVIKRDACFRVAVDCDFIDYVVSVD